METGLQLIDAYTAVYSASCESRQSGLVNALLAALQYSNKAERNTQTEVTKMTRQQQCESSHTPLQSHHADSDDGINTSIRLQAVLELLQDCCSTSVLCRESEEQKFISTVSDLRSLNTAARTVRASTSSVDTSFTGVPHTVDGVCLAHRLHVGLEDLQLMNPFGQPQQEEEGECKGHFLRGVIKSFRVVTDETIPKNLYYLVESFFCELPYCWLLHTFFANTPMSLIGSEEGFNMAKEQLELQASSLRFLLSIENAMESDNPEDSRSRMWRRTQLCEMLNEVATTHDVLCTDVFLRHIAAEWRQCMRALAISLSSLDATISGFSSNILLERLQRLLLRSPQRVSYGIVHSFLLPLVGLTCSEEAVRRRQGDGIDEIQHVIALIAASFEGTSLEEVEYFLQPSEADHTSSAKLYHGGTELTARLYKHFYETFAQLLRTSSIYAVDIVLMPSPFFDIHTSPFIRSVHPTRLAGVVRSHLYALFDVLAEKTCKVKTVVLFGGAWVHMARGLFQQWLSEGKNEGLSICVIFKQLWDLEEDEGGYPQFMPLLHQIIARVHTAQVAVFIPAPKVALLSRRYGAFPLVSSSQHSVKKEAGIAEQRSLRRGNHLLFTEMLQCTLMPVVSYSMCAGAPLAYIYDTSAEEEEATATCDVLASSLLTPFTCQGVFPSNIYV